MIHNYELQPNETVAGRIARLPRPGKPRGNALFLELPDSEVVALPATAKKGHSVLARELGRFKKGDSIEIAYYGKKPTVDGERSYRLYEVRHAD